MSKRHYDITRGEITQQFANLELPTNLQNVLDEAKSKVAKILGTDVETPVRINPITRSSGLTMTNIYQAPAISVIAPEPPPVPMEVEKAEESMLSLFEYSHEFRSAGCAGRKRARRSRTRGFLVSELRRSKNQSREPKLTSCAPNVFARGVEVTLFQYHEHI